MFGTARFAGITILEVERAVVLEGCQQCGDAALVHYEMTIQVGPGAHDKISIHRLVKERTPGFPVATKEGLLAIHGGMGSFELVYMPSTLSTLKPVEHSLGIFLALNDLDVWGIDVRWALVPEDTSDFSFMREWDTALAVSDIELTLSFARLARLLTGSGPGKMFVTGWSRGAHFTYALANKQAQIPPGLRQLKGIIPVDYAYKFDPADEQSIDAACLRQAELQSLIGAGTYVNTMGKSGKTVAYLASVAPNSPSPLPGFELFTNKDVAMLFLGATHVLEAHPTTPWMHWAGSQFGLIGPGIPGPVAMLFSDFDYVIEIAQAATPYYPEPEHLDEAILQCNFDDSSYDDHLGEIDVPVLYIGAAGGFGSTGEYVLELLGGPTESLIVSLAPSPHMDFGHSDLYWGDQADLLAWQPMLDWILANR